MPVTKLLQHPGACCASIHASAEGLADPTLRAPPQPAARNCMTPSLRLHSACTPPAPHLPTHPLWHIAEWPVRASAASALGSIALDIEGKRQAFEAGAAESLIALLRDKNLPVVLLSVRALSVGKMYVCVCAVARC